MKPNEATIANLKQELQQALDTLINNYDTGLIIVDILPIVRKYIEVEWVKRNTKFDELMDQVQLSNIHNEVPGLNILMTNGKFDELNKQHVSSYEGDNIYITFDGYSSNENKYITEIDDELLNVIAFIMLHDCTHCCNALKFINLSRRGLFAAGDISTTYHS